MEIVRTIYDNNEMLEYIKSGKADYFGFASEEELWEDRILFRTHRYAEFTCCIDYVCSEDGKDSTDKIIYVLLKLRATFRDWEDEKVLVQVKEFINTFNNNEIN